MGWTYLQKPNDMSVIEFFKKEFATDNDRVTIEVLDGADLGSEVYLATKITPKIAGLRVSETLVPADDGSVIFAIVCLIDKAHGRYNFGYKDMYENMGPYAHHCPANKHPRHAISTPGPGLYDVQVCRALAQCLPQ